MSPDNHGIWKETYRIRSHEVDRKSRALPHILLCYMLDSAWAHVKDSEFSFNSLQNSGYFWVLARFIAVFHHLPKWSDEITIETWGKGTDKLFAFRDYIIYSQTQEKLVSATSSWLIIDRKTMHPQKMDTLKAHFPFQMERDELNIQLGRIPVKSIPGTETKNTVHYSDLDVNQHVNSSKYLQWILDSFPLEILEKKNIKSFEINYIAEAQLGDLITVFTAPDDGAYFCSIKRENDSVELCRAKVAWNDI